MINFRKYKGIQILTWAAVFFVVVFASVARAAGDGPNSDFTKKKINEIRHKIEVLRGLKFTSEVKTVPMDGAAMMHVTEQIMKRQGMDDARIEVMRKVLAAFGLLPPDYDLKSALKDVLTEQIQGLYDPEKKTLYVRSDISFSSIMPEDVQKEVGVSESEIALSHELEHALQDQHFDLLRMLGMRETSEDKAFAFDAVAEGDATIVMLDYGMSGLGFTIPDAPMYAKLMESFLFSKSGQEQFSSLAELPNAIKMQVLSPYTEGMKFVSYLYKKGGWPLVDYALANPPEGTSQILHPEKFLGARDNPVIMKPRDVSAEIGGGYKLVDSNVAGELMTALILAEFLGKDEKKTVDAAAEGWHGDRYMYYENAEGKPLLAWITTWDTEKDANGFFNAMSAAMDKRFGKKGDSPVAAIVTWYTPCGLSRIWLHDSDVTFIHCAPKESFGAIEKALAESEREKVDSPGPDMTKFKGQ